MSRTRTTSRSTGSYAALRPGLPGAIARVEELREDLRGRSRRAAQSRYDRQVNEGFRDLETAQREAKAFATDRETRYLAVEAPWVGEVAHEQPAERRLAIHRSVSPVPDARSTRRFP